MVEAIRTSKFEPVELVASGTRSTLSSVTTTGATFRLPKDTSAVIMVLDATAVDDDGTDTLNVHIESQIDGTNWIDICAFTEVVGNAGTKRIVAKIMKETAQTMFADGALTAGNVRHLLGENLRAVYTIVEGGGADVSFTFRVTMTPW